MEDQGPLFIRVYPSSSLEIGSPQQIAHLPCVGDLFTYLAYARGANGERLIYSVSSEQHPGKVG